MKSRAFLLGLALAVVLTGISAIARAAPAVTVTCTPTSGTSPVTATIAWTVTDANTCTASGSWTGTKALTGSQSLTNLTAPARYVLTCTKNAVADVVHLSWTPPTQNTDGTPLTDLAGHRIAHGTSATALTQTIEVTPATVKEYDVEGLPNGTRYFAVRAYNSKGGESVNSNVASKNVASTPAQTAAGECSINVTKQPNAPTLLTVEPTAYRLDLGYTNQIKVARVGTVPLGKPCKDQEVFGLNVLADRNLATIDAGKARPLAVLAKCKDEAVER